MGTRAAFWMGDPRDLDHREWLGCVAWDGYPEGIENIENVKTEEDFRRLVNDLRSREDFADPSKGGWPFPWDDDVFLTDYTYAFFDGGLNIACFHTGFIAISELCMNAGESDFEERDTLPKDIPAPLKYDRGQPDSIMYVTMRG